MPDDIVIRFSAKDDASTVITRVNEKIGGTKKESQALVPGLENARKSLTGFVGDNAALIGVLVGVGVAIGKVIKDHIAYADAVRTLSNLSGESTENTSRFIQVLDDYKLSTDDALTATRSLTKNGLAPNIETLAKLSDEYLSINDVEKQNEFIMKNLGRGGAAWTDVLKKGSKALLEQAAAVDKNLILNRKMTDDARKAEIAMDNWNDSVLALKTSLAIGLVPALTGVLNAANNTARAHEILNEQGKNWFFTSTKNKEAAYAQAAAEQEAATALMLSTGEMDKNTESAKANEEALKEQEKVMKALSDMRVGMLGTIGDMQQLEADHTKEQADLLADITKLEKERAEEVAKGYEMDKEKIEEYDGAIEKNWEQVRINQKEHERANYEIISGLVERKLMQDGILDNKEFEYLIRLREEWGLYSHDVVEKARAAWQEADRIASAINGIPSSKSVSIDVFSNYAYPYALGSSFGAGGGGGGGGRDSGGYGAAGKAYTIGKGAQPEMFIPSTNGQFVPNADKNMGIDYKKLARVLRDTLAQAGG